RFKTVTNAANKVKEIFSTFTVRANGASLLNGFGFQLPDAAGVSPSDYTVTGYSLLKGIITLNANHTEAGQTKPTIIVFDNTSDLMPGFSNTELGEPYVTPVPIEITISVIGGSYVASDFSLYCYAWNKG
ncbi:MAG: LruC domain-containing protein, partial [bacterium]